MSTPRGKAIYARLPAWYPGGNPALYAAQLGCNFIALHHFASGPEHVAQAKALGLSVYLWSHPGSWTPSEWPATLDSMAERVYTENLTGFIADPEFGWESSSRQAFADQLTIAVHSLPSVGLTSYPSWYIQDFEQAAAAGLWGSPQLYSVIDPGPPAELQRRKERWVKLFGASQVVPSIAAWNRGPEEQAAYLDGFRGERGGILWQVATAQGADGKIKPWPGSAGFDVLRGWQPGYAQLLLATLSSRIVQPFPLLRRG